MGSPQHDNKQNFNVLTNGPFISNNNDIIILNRVNQQNDLEYEDDFVQEQQSS